MRRAKDGEKLASISTGRSILEAGYIRSETAIKRTRRKPKTCKSLSGLEFKEPKIQLDYKAKKGC